MVKTIGGGVLDGEELARIGIVFDVAIGAHEQFVAGHETATPAGHIEAFAGGMQFHPHFFGARNG